MDDMKPANIPAGVPTVNANKEMKQPPDKNDQVNTKQAQQQEDALPSVKY